MQKRFLIIFVFFVLCFGTIFGQNGYEIKLSIPNAPNQTLYLGHHFGSSMYVNDTVILNAQGVGSFNGREILPGGMYIVYFAKTRTYFDILLDKSQYFTVETDTTDFMNTTKFKNSEENVLFFEYQKFLYAENMKVSTLRDQRTANEGNEAEIKRIDEQLNVINEEVITERERIISKYPTMFLSTFLAMTREIEVPDAPLDANGNPDPSFQYYYYRAHYFDNFNFKDPRILRTPLFEPKFKEYIEKVLPQIPDTLIAECDRLIANAEGDSAMFRFVVGTLYNTFVASQIMGMDAVFVHLAKNYYLKRVWWNDAESIEKIRERVTAMEPLLQGKVAPNLKMLSVPADYFKKVKQDSTYSQPYNYGQYINLHDIRADYTILIFWEADCSHCKVAVPELGAMYSRLKEHNAEVVAFNMLGNEEGRVKWAEFINSHQLYDWINVWDPTYVSRYKDLYNINSSPVIILLDKDKIIRGKKVGPDQAEELIYEFQLRKLILDADESQHLTILKNFIGTFSTPEGKEIAKRVADRYVTLEQKEEFDKWFENQ